MCVEGVWVSGKKEHAHPVLSLSLFVPSRHCSVLSHLFCVQPRRLAAAAASISTAAADVAVAPARRAAAVADRVDRHGAAGAARRHAVAGEGVGAVDDAPGVRVGRQRHHLLVLFCVCVLGVGGDRLLMIAQSAKRADVCVKRRRKRGVGDDLNLDRSIDRSFPPLVCSRVSPLALGP